MNLSHQNFFAQARNIHIVHIARYLGLQINRNEKCAGPCPACDNFIRSQKRKDHRLPLGFRADGLGWECQHCHEKGDGIELVSLVLSQARFRQLSNHAQSEVRQWYIEQGFVTGLHHTSLNPYKPQLVPPPLTLIPKKTLPVCPETSPTHPPQEELQTLWNTCIPVCEDRETNAMLERRGISPSFISFLDLARTLPTNAPKFPWTNARGIPWQQGWRMLLPAFDSQGQMKSIKARWVRKENAPAEAKSVSPSGYQIKDLLLADPISHQLLQHAEIPDSWAKNQNFYLWIVEGDMDFLGLNNILSQAQMNCNAIFGIWAGSWNESFANRLPLDQRIQITVATDPDKNGDMYASKIIKTLITRGFHSSQMKRWTP